MKKSIADANVSYNGDFFEFITMSRGMLGYADPDVPTQVLEPDAADEELGRAARQALAGSKRISVSDFQILFKSGEVQKKQKEREAAIVKRYGYKSRRTMFLNMMCCDVSMYDDGIQIKPLHHNSIDGYSGISQDGPEILRLPSTASDLEVGAALREGFRRCTSEWP
jgi:hypothetical protein